MKSWTRFPYVRYAVALAAGITAFVLTETATRWLWGGWAASGAITLFFSLKPVRTGPRRADLFRGVPALVFVFVGGWLLAGARSELDDSTHFQRIANVEAYEAVLVAQPESRPTYFRAIAEVRRVRAAGTWRPATGRVLLSLEKPLPRPRYGDVLLVRGTPQPAKGPLNPGEFDYRRYLRFQQVFHRDFVNSERFRVVRNDPPSRTLEWACRANRHADSVLVARLGDRREYGVAKAVLLGVRDDLDADLMRAYSASGAIHVLSVSGLHVGILFVTLGFLLNVLKKRGRGGRWTVVVLKLLVLWGYALVTGLSPAVLRSAAMFSLFTLAEAMQRPPAGYNVLFASAFGLLLIDPFLLASAGFQLSYLAVGGLLYLQPRIERWWGVENKPGRWLWKVTATALAAQVVTFPLAVYYFHQFPVYFLVVNPAVIGLAAVVVPVGLGFLIFEGIPFLSDLLAALTRIAFWLLNEVAAQTERLPHAIWSNLHLTTAETLGVYGLLGCLLALFHTRKKSYAWAAAAMAVTLSGYAVVQKEIQHRQSGLVVHHIPQHTALSLVDGNTLTVLADSELVPRPRLLDYACAGFWAGRGIRYARVVRFDSPQRGGVRIEAAEGGTVVTGWKQHPLVVVTQPLRRLSARRRPLVVLVRGRAGRRVFPAAGNTTVVLDGSVTPRQAARWRERGQPAHATAERGAWVAGF